MMVCVCVIVLVWHGDCLRVGIMCVSRSVCESAVSLYPCVNVVGRIGVTLLWCSVLGMLCHCCVPLRSAVCQEMCMRVTVTVCV